MSIIGKDDLLEDAHLDFSVRLAKRIKLTTIRTVGDFLDYPVEDWSRIRGLGKKVLAEIEVKKAELQAAMGTAGRSGEEGALEEVVLPSDYLELVGRLVASLGLAYDEAVRSLSDICREQPGLPASGLASSAFGHKMIRKAIEGKVLDLLAPYGSEQSRQELARSLPPPLDDPLLLGGLLDEMVEGGSLVVSGMAFQDDDRLYRRRYLTAAEYVASWGGLSERNRKVLVNYLSGDNTRELGDDFAFSRQRADQICKKFLRMLEGKPLVENRFLAIFRKYSFSAESFTSIFHEPRGTFLYLRSLGVAGKGVLSRNIIYDADFPRDCLQSAVAYFDRDYLVIEPYRIKKEKKDLLQFYLKTHCQAHPVEEGMIFLGYEDFLRANGLQDEPRFSFPVQRNRMAYLARCPFVLFSGGERGYRYYNITVRDFRPLLQGIDFQRYQGMDMTTVKIFREHEGLMEDFGLQNEYELHNLFRKIMDMKLPQSLAARSEWEKSIGECQEIFVKWRVQLNKTPTILFGDTDRETQIVNLLWQNGPMIRRLELAKLYEEKYGTNAVVASGYFSNYRSIDVYYSKGSNSYSLIQEELPEEQYERMRGLLREDFYQVEDIQRIFEEDCSGSKGHVLNTLNIQRMGYRVNSGYAFRETWGSASAYFRHCLQEPRFLDLDRFPSSITNIGNFNSELAALRTSRELVECEPRKYINFKELADKGITKDDLAGYCRSVREFVPHDTFFTIASIRKDGFNDPLAWLGYEPWFYSSLLAEDHDHFSFLRLRDARLLYSGKRKLQVPAFLAWLAGQEEGGFDFDAVWKKLSDHYGLHYSREAFLSFVQEANL